MNGYIENSCDFQIERKFFLRVILAFSLISGLAFSLGALLFFRAPASLQADFCALTMAKFDFVPVAAGELSDLCFQMLKTALADIVFLCLIELCSFSAVSCVGCALLLAVRGFFLGIRVESSIAAVWQNTGSTFLGFCRVGGVSICFFALFLLLFFKSTDAVYFARTHGVSRRRRDAFFMRFFCFGAAIGAIQILNLFLSILLS